MRAASVTGSKEEEEWCLINRGLERTVKDGWSSLLRIETKLGLEAMIMMFGNLISAKVSRGHALTIESAYCLYNVCLCNCVDRARWTRSLQE